MLAILCGLLPAGARAASRWTPPQQLTWYWQLTGTPKVEPVAATDIDGFDNSSGTVANFHAIGQRMICYIDVGTSENWRPDASQFPGHRSWKQQRLAGGAMAGCASARGARADHDGAL